MTAPAPRGNEDFARLWDTRRGFGGWLGAVNHKQVGKRFLVTAFIFFLIGGVQALIMRIQLGTPDNTFLDPQTYNELFTMHGTTMLFLFAIPVTEALAIYFGPLMLGARDMPFPRLNAFGYWAYLAGGIFLYSSFFVGSAPDGGWFAYAPLTGPEFSPRASMDFWLLGVTFVEIAGIVAAIEIVVLVLKTRAPGMSISRMPLFVWAVFVTACMVLIAFPPLVMGSIMLELDRKLATQFFSAAGGGDPLLWQHIFWWFGHPEVYIMSLPTFGVVSTIIPVIARRPMIGYVFIAASAVAIGVISFGTWAHHMFATGLPLLGLSFFAAATLVVAVPSAVQFFAWLATMWAGTIRWNAQTLFLIGFFVVFAMGGITGVMFAVVPFTWQAHDTYFVVAHFHYVIFGSMIFPMFAGFYYWTPKITGRLLSDRLGRWAFVGIFAGTHLTFFPMHQLGLLGMARRIYAWPAGFGWELGNLIATVGAFVFAAGVAVFIVDFLRHFRYGPLAGNDPWGANTLEWAAASPPAGYNFRTIPTVTTRDPLWDEPGRFDPELEPGELSARGIDSVEERYTHRPNRREMLATSVLDADPEEVVTLPAHSWWPLFVAASIAVLLTGALVDALPAVLVGVGAVAAGVVGWSWGREDEPGPGQRPANEEAPA
jgi:cytochrome c oxidase subunit I+III